jgi:hypothetical protein
VREQKVELHGYGINTLARFIAQTFAAKSSGRIKLELQRLGVSSTKYTKAHSVLHTFSTFSFYFVPVWNWVRGNKNS